MMVIIVVVLQIASTTGLFVYLNMSISQVKTQGVTEELRCLGLLNALDKDQEIPPNLAQLFGEPCVKLAEGIKAYISKVTENIISKPHISRGPSSAPDQSRQCQSHYNPATLRPSHTPGQRWARVSLEQAVEPGDEACTAAAPESSHSGKTSAEGPGGEGEECCRGVGFHSFTCSSSTSYRFSRWRSTSGTPNCISLPTRRLTPPPHHLLLPFHGTGTVSGSKQWSQGMKPAQPRHPKAVTVVKQPL
ncbi:hypothetical protein SKAU_G00274180 [Synaphobranchus kaupii]|uniref:Uncharacterized protein n=1 Tax=Synaphobranchus kaupii TaxID=118154 RepID=A0A9Q1F174_SYNKA|nr:hypothetical protein SKAU_G00274180 [Synaphobranchus kaupii]